MTDQERQYGPGNTWPKLAHGKRLTKIKAHTTMCGSDDASQLRWLKKE